jgi:ABC-2 type transport system ATP-binding protein
MRGLIMCEIIRVKDLSRKFGNFTAVDRINFTIKKGEILGFLGPNGAGKTTTIKMINGLLKVSSGSVEIKGLDIVKNRREIKKIIGYMSQKFSLYPLLSAFDNVEFFGGISGLSGKMIEFKKNELERFISREMLTRKIGDIPPGIKQEVALFVCLLSNPEIIFLDEPTSGVDPENRRKFWYKIYALKEKGKTILVTTHNLEEAEYADRILIIHKGEIIEEGEPYALVEKYQTDSVESVFLEAINR